MMATRTGTQDEVSEREDKTGADDSDVPLAAFEWRTTYVNDLRHRHVAPHLDRCNLEGLHEECGAE